ATSCRSDLIAVPAVDAARPGGYYEPPATATSRGGRLYLTPTRVRVQLAPMQDDPRETAARRAIDAGDWQTARNLFETLTRETNAPEACAGLAEAAWLQQDSRLMI